MKFSQLGSDPNSFCHEILPKSDISYYVVLPEDLSEPSQALDHSCCAVLPEGGNSYRAILPKESDNQEASQTEE